MKLAYLSDVFGKLNKLNLQLQGRDKRQPHIADKITAFTRKLEVWGRHLDQGNTDAFENLSEIAETSTSGATTVIPSPADFSSAEEDQFIEMTSDSTLIVSSANLNLAMQSWVSSVKSSGLSTWGTCAQCGSAQGVVANTD
ncbi:unnamed protein product [Leuciscus chuanchicus]